MLLTTAFARMFEVFIILVGLAMTCMSFIMLIVGFELTTSRDRGLLLEAASLRQRLRGSIFRHWWRLAHLGSFSASSTNLIITRAAFAPGAPILFFHGPPGPSGSQYHLPRAAAGIIYDFIICPGRGGGGAGGAGINT